MMQHLGEAAKSIVRHDCWAHNRTSRETQCAVYKNCRDTQAKFWMEMQHNRYSELGHVVGIAMHTLINVPIWPLAIGAHEA